MLMRKKLRLRNKFIPVNTPKLFNQEKINLFFLVLSN